MINKLGFGCLRLPKKDEEFDWNTVCERVDTFMTCGAAFFDTCHTYLNDMLLLRCKLNDNYFFFRNNPCWLQQ